MLPDFMLLDLFTSGMNGWVFRLEQQKDPVRWRRFPW